MIHRTIARKALRRRIAQRVASRQEAPSAKRLFSYRIEKLNNNTVRVFHLPNRQVFDTVGYFDFDTNQYQNQQLHQIADAIGAHVVDVLQVEDMDAYQLSSSLMQQAHAIHQKVVVYGAVVLDYAKGSWNISLRSRDLPL